MSKENNQFNWEKVVGISGAAIAVGAIGGYSLGTHYEVRQLLGDPVVSTAFATWSLVLFTAILSVGVFVAWWQLRADHARSRGELAIQLGTQWVRDHCERCADAMRLINAMSSEETKQIRRREAVSVDYKLHPMLARVFPEFAQATTNGDSRINLDAQHSSELRWLVVRHLNQLESIFSAWLYTIADRQIIEDEFMSLIATEDGDLLAERFRAGSDNKGGWPAIAAFVAEWRLRNQQIPVGRASVA